MEHRKLYIIGNGFDLHHGILTGYGNFKKFVQRHEPDLLKNVEAYLPAGEEWCDLEVALAELDVDNIITDLEQFMPSYGAEDWSDSGHHDFQFEVERLAECLSITLLRQFEKWIRQVRIPTPATARRRLRTLDPNARFLTFNYTPTLQKVYGVSESHVLHIHGRADSQDKDLILGHARNPQEKRSLNDRPDIAEIDTRLMEANNILDEYFSKTFKPSARLLEEHRPFFDGLVGVQEVVILGHSLSQVDGAYFHRLLSVPGISSACWKLACRANDDKHTKNARLQQLGVEVRNITICSWSEL